MHRFLAYIYKLNRWNVRIVRILIHQDFSTMFHHVTTSPVWKELHSLPASYCMCSIFNTYDEPVFKQGGCRYADFNPCSEAAYFCLGFQGKEKPYLSWDSLSGQSATGIILVPLHLKSQAVVGSCIVDLRICVAAGGWTNGRGSHFYTPLLQRSRKLVCSAGQESITAAAEGSMDHRMGTFSLELYSKMSI